MPYGITQYYRPPGRGDIPAFVHSLANGYANARQSVINKSIHSFTFSHSTTRKIILRRRRSNEPVLIKLSPSSCSFDDLLLVLLTELK